jgi:hypothetical protein
VEDALPEFFKVVEEGQQRVPQCSSALVLRCFLDPFARYGIIEHIVNVDLLSVLSSCPG